MNVQITCTCGYPSRGDRSAVVRDLQAHCQQVHGVQVDPARIEAKVVPFDSAPQAPASTRNGDSPTSAQVAGVGLQVAVLVADLVSRRARRPVTARIAQAVAQQLGTIAARESPAAAATTGARSPVGPAGGDSLGDRTTPPARTPIVPSGPAQSPAQASASPAPATSNVNEAQLNLMKLQRRQQEELMALRGMEGAINQMSSVKLGLGPHY